MSSCTPYTDKCAQLLSAASDLSASRRMVVGVASTVPDLPEDVRSGPDFDALVTAFFGWYCESLADDLEFLWPETLGPVPLFRRVLITLRHARQHHGTNRFATEAEGWFKDKIGALPTTSQEWITCAVALVDCGLHALVAVCRKAVAARQPPGSDQWRKALEWSPESQMALAFQDLGRAPKGPRYEYLVRQFRSSPARRSARTAQRGLDVARAMIVGEGLARVELPIDGAQLLEELGLLGSPDAQAVLAFALGCVELPGVPQDAGNFVEYVRAALAT